MNQSEILVQQYELVKASREAVLHYCKQFSQSDYIASLEVYGRRSMRNLQAHIANIYVHWLANFALKKSITYFQPDSIHNYRGNA